MTIYSITPVMTYMYNYYVRWYKPFVLFQKDVPLSIRWYNHLFYFRRIFHYLYDGTILCSISGGCSPICIYPSPDWIPMRCTTSCWTYYRLTSGDSSSSMNPGSRWAWPNLSRTTPPMSTPRVPVQGRCGWREKSRSPASN